MTDFIRDLENELRAASTRKVRLATARVPRLPATGVAVVLSAAVCVIVALSVLQGHGRRPDRSASGSSVTQTSGTNHAPGKGAPTQTPAPTHDAVIKDCLKHGSLTGHYTKTQLRHALATMPAPERAYTNCVSVIQTALRHG
jgi:hypothetical protein